MISIAIAIPVPRMMMLMTMLLRMTLISYEMKTPSRIAQRTRIDSSPRSIPIRIRIRIPRSSPRPRTCRPRSGILLILLEGGILTVVDIGDIGTGSVSLHHHCFPRVDEWRVEEWRV
jgi:hypothetical protein